MKPVAATSGTKTESLYRIGGRRRARPRFSEPATGVQGDGGENAPGRSHARHRRMPGPRRSTSRTARAQSPVVLGSWRRVSPVGRRQRRPKRSLKSTDGKAHVTGDEPPRLQDDFSSPHFLSMDDLRFGRGFYCRVGVCDRSALARRPARPGERFGRVVATSAVGSRSSIVSPRPPARMDIGARLFSLPGPIHRLGRRHWCGVIGVPFLAALRLCPLCSPRVYALGTRTRGVAFVPDEARRRPTRSSSPATVTFWKK